MMWHLLITFFGVCTFLIDDIEGLRRNNNRGTVSPPRTDFDCGTRGFVPIVFGFGINPQSSRFSKRSASQSLPKFTISDTVIEPSVVGGHESFKNSWPWMALLGVRRGRRNTFFCSGVLINKEFILTAAHCIGEYDKFFVRLGEHNYIEGTRDAKDFEVSRVHLHPDYRANLGYNDVALIKLSKKVKFTSKIKPVCLPWGSKANENLVNQRAVVTGWGTTSFGGPLSGTLQEVRISIFNTKKCHNSYSSLRDFRTTFPSGMNAGNIICAGDRKGGKDACQGDSGGPILKEEKNGKFTMVGVVSKGYGCGHENFPGLYAPLGTARTLKWIKKVAF